MSQNQPQDIYAYITQEETAYQLPIDVNGWDWSMAEHLKTSFFYKNGRLLTGNTDDKPVKNIVKPIINLQNRATGFDVKDIELYINDLKQYYKSFMVNKWHDSWALENKIDTFIDDFVASYIDYGLTLIKKLKGQVAPEVIDLQSIAFCDQSDILSAPIGIKHYFSPDQLKDFEVLGWGDEKNGATVTVDELIILSRDERVNKDGKQSKSTGKQIKVYEVHGTLDENYLPNTEDVEENSFVGQMQIVAFYQKEKGKKQGVTLFAGKEKDSPFKALKRDKIFGRACGFGGIEELFEDQVWTTYSTIKKKDMLDAASVTILKTTDAAFAKRNNVKDMENLEIAVLQENTDLSQVDTFPRNIALFDKSVEEWQAHAQQMGSANESILGENPTSGTPFALQQLVTAESHSLHEFRKGQIASFFSDEIYKDWLIPDAVKEITKGKEFLADLDADELQQIADSTVQSQVELMKVDRILDGKEAATEEEIQIFEAQTRNEFMRGGRRRFLKILKGEMKDAPMSVRVNIVGKQKNLAGMTDKLVNIFRQIVATPQVLDDPRMANLFNQIIESSGLSPIDFGYTNVKKQLETPQQQPQPASATAPIEDLTSNQV